jgi:hypothetical protein
LPPSSGLKSKASKKQAEAGNNLFHPEYGGDMFLRNVGSLYRTTRQHIAENITLFIM